LTNWVLYATYTLELKGIQMPSRPELPATTARYIAAWIAGLSTHAFNRGYINTGLVKCDERGRVYTRSLAEAFETLGQPPLTPEAYWIAYGARENRRAYQRTYRRNQLQKSGPPPAADTTQGTTHGPPISAF
jgi:hypothetical protein